VHADTIIRESAGSPFLVEQMCGMRSIRMTPPGRRASAWAKCWNPAYALSRKGRARFLATLAVAGRPVDAKVARAAAGLEGDDRRWSHS